MDGIIFFFSNFQVFAELSPIVEFFAICSINDYKRNMFGSPSDHIVQDRTMTF